MPANPSLGSGRAAGGPGLDPGGRSVDSMWARRQSVTRKDPQDLELQLTPFNFHEDEEDDTNKSVSTVELDKMFKEWAEHLLAEDSRGNIKRILKFPETIANKFHSKDSKHSFYYAQLFKDYIKSYQHVFDDDDMSETITNEYLHELLEDFYFDEQGLTIQPVIEFINDAQGNFNKIKKITSFVVAVEFANLQLKERIKSGKFIKQNTILKFNDGFYWLNLGSCESAAEGDEMQHCGFDERGDLISLRDKSNKPHVTLTYDDHRNEIFDMRGKQNKFPKQKYYSHIRALISHLNADASAFADELGLGEGLLPFKDSTYYDINSDEDDFIPDVDFYLANTRLRGQDSSQTDYEKQVLHQRPTTAGLGYGRATGRTRSDFSQSNADHSWPGKPKKMSYKDLRDLIKTEVKMLNGLKLSEVLDINGNL